MPEAEATARLHAQVIQAIEAGRSKRVVEPLLERLVAIATPGSDAALLAHRELAEFRLKQHPWRSLLHLKHVLAATPDDDHAHAMSGIGHALLGNFKSATKAYQTALQHAPTNAWYHHNLGHIWSVARGEPKRALPHLKKAFDELGDQAPEIVTSYLLCLQRLGGKYAEEAARVALTTSRKESPRIEGLPRSPRANSPPPNLRQDDAVMSIMRGHVAPSSTHYRRVRKLWFQVRELLLGDAPSVNVLAACVDYAVLQAASPPETLRAVATRHGVDWKLLQAQYETLVARAPKVVDKLRSQP